MNQIKSLTEKIGEGSREIQSSNLEWHARSSPTALMQVEADADMLEAEIESLIDKDPEGACKSMVGIWMLEGYAKLGILEGTQSDYPYRFSGPDLIKDCMCIQAQLVAEEYYEEGPEACPLTPEAFLNWDFEKNRKSITEEWKDPFETMDRPNVTIDYVEKMERVKLNATTGS